MLGVPEVVDYLNTLLRGELAARDQYFLHSRRYAHLGLDALYERTNHEMQEETEHADALIRRLLFLEAEPDMRPNAFKAGLTVEEMIRKDLALEYDVRANLAQGIALCEKHQDFISRELLVDQLKDTEEDHAYWLERQLSLIERIGMERYQQAKID